MSLPWPPCTRVGNSRNSQADRSPDWSSKPCRRLSTPTRAGRTQPQRGSAADCACRSLLRPARPRHDPRQVRARGACRSECLHLFARPPLRVSRSRRSGETPTRVADVSQQKSPTPILTRGGRFAALPDSGIRAWTRQRALQTAVLVKLGKVLIPLSTNTVGAAPKRVWGLKAGRLRGEG
jgi:hypothetical protein